MDTRLPATYLSALRLLADGEEAAAIGAHLGIPEESVTPLLRLAVAKTLRLIDEEPDSAGGHTKETT